MQISFYTTQSNFLKLIKMTHVLYEDLIYLDSTKKIIDMEQFENIEPKQTLKTKLTFFNSIVHAMRKDVFLNPMDSDVHLILGNSLDFIVNYNPTTLLDYDFSKYLTHESVLDDYVNPYKPCTLYMNQLYYNCDEFKEVKRLFHTLKRMIRDNSIKHKTVEGTTYVLSL